MPRSSEMTGLVYLASRGGEAAAWFCLLCVVVGSLWHMLDIKKAIIAAADQAIAACSAPKQLDDPGGDQ